VHLLWEIIINQEICPNSGIGLKCTEETNEGYPFFFFKGLTIGWLLWGRGHIDN
jgi:hypothetical protein